MKLSHRIISPPKTKYYHLWIAAAKDQVFFQNNLDKAYIITLFQDLLSPRNSFENIQNFSKDLELIAYSLTEYGMNLLLVGTHTRAIEDFGQSLIARYIDYLHQQRSWEIVPFDTIFAYDDLADEHEALAISREIHLLHKDWRNDRYSSIGFYLDDRRGDWLNAKHLADLYENDAIWYQNFLMDNDEPVEIDAFKFIET
jgi:hypothetical protein